MKIPLVILSALLVALLGITGYGIYKFQQSNAFIKLGNQALINGKIPEAKEYYGKARDAFPYRPAASQIFEGLNIFNDTNEAYNPVIPSRPTPTPVLPLVQPVVALKEVRVPILMYHHIRINPLPFNPLWAGLFVSPSQLEDQLKYLTSQNYHTITLDDMMNALDGEKTLPQNPVILTFDDGYQSFYDNAYPLLKKYNMKAINFIITDVVGSGVYLKWNEIKAMYATGLISFGGHTKHHPFLTAIPTVLASDEIIGSKKDLEKNLHTKILWFAYPYGDYNQNIVNIVKSAGYTGAVTTNFGALQSKKASFTMPRIMIDGRFTVSKIASLLQQ